MRATGTVLIAFLLLNLGACHRQVSSGPAPPPTRREIWDAIRPLADRYRMSPEFVYALVAAESNFDPAARNGEARGLLQLKPRAWRAVSAVPYDPAVGDWRTNLEVGIDYLAYSRSYLHRKNVFSYPLLLAAFHYGLDYVEERDFDIGRIPKPGSPTYRELWSGNLAPVAPPQ
jgi:soluble lytic murein transglycosylase-like protein